MSEWKAIKPSEASVNTSNPIRKAVDQMLIKPETDKAPIPLSIGDPCTDGNLLPPQETIDALTEIIKSSSSNGYPPSAGYDDARAAVAEKFPGHADFKVDKSDVFITSGASHAIQIAFDAIMNPGDNILLPQPGFSLYKTICDSKGFESNFYSLVPERNWECDLADMKSKINSKTKAIFINNPSNPCGSNFSKEHLVDILKLAEETKLPIISDEIYDGMVFEGETFTSITTLTTTVPVLVIGGIAKQYVVPGWRLGWLVVHDRNGCLKDLKGAILALTTIILGPNSTVQAALRNILFDTPESYYTGLISTLNKHANVVYSEIEKIDGLTPIKPQGAMYVMVGIDVARFPAFKSDIDFSRELLREEAVMVLPGSCFMIDNYFRIVFTKPAEKLQEAVGRIAEFCARHRK